MKKLHSKTLILIAALLIFVAVPNIGFAAEPPTDLIGSFDPGGSLELFENVVWVLPEGAIDLMIAPDPYDVGATIELDTKRIELTPSTDTALSGKRVMVVEGKALLWSTVGSYTIKGWSPKGGIPVVKTGPMASGLFGPPPPMNPTPEPTRVQQEIRDQAEPTLIIAGIPHNADLNPDARIFEARGIWVKLDEDGQLPEPPKDRVALYNVGYLYGQTPDGKAELVASDGDIHAYIHNAQRWAEANWPKWKDWLSLAFDQEGIKVGDLIEFGGAKYKVIRLDPVDPKSMLADLFSPTKEFMGRRLVISTCSTPPEGVYTSSGDLGLPRQVVTAVLVESEAASA